MRIFRVLLAFSLVVIGVASTVGSGGGGGGSSDWDKVKFSPGCCSVPGPTADLDITIANAQDVSATVVRVITQVFDVAAKIGGQIFPSPPSAADLLSSSSRFELIATVAESGIDAADACAVSGTVTVSGSPWENDPEPMALSVGDTFNLVLDTCDDGDGYILDGSFSLNVRGLDGDTRTDVFRLGYELLNLTLTVTSGVDNDVALSDPYRFFLEWNSLDFPVVVLTASSGSLQLSSQEDDLLLGGVDHSLTVNADVANPATQKEASSYLIESAVLGGHISYEVIDPLQAPDGQDPESGEILISGGVGNGTIHIVIESSASVRLEIDVDGDGNVDDYQYTTWVALQSWKSI
jgi:hypothetical protein